MHSMSTLARWGGALSASSCLQSDGCSCGLWILVVDRAFVAYVDSTDFGNYCFESFLRDWLAERGVVDLFLVGQSGRKKAIKGNLQFIQEERQQLRTRLRVALGQDNLDIATWVADGCLLEAFAEDSSKVATEQELQALDDRLNGR